MAKRSRAPRALLAKRARSPKSAGDVVLGTLLAWAGEDVISGAEFDEFAEIHERREVGRARSLLHVVGDDRDRVIGLELIDQLFDLGGRDRIERRSRFVEQQPVRAHGDRTGDAPALRLATAQKSAENT